jgi:hypothetical protein
MVVCMARDWSSAAQDDFVVDARLARAAEASVSATERHALAAAASTGFRVDRLGFPLLCLLAGGMATLLYVWPVLFLVDIFTGGFRPALFGAILLGGGILAAAAFWVIGTLERRHWARSLGTLGDFADPPVWK